MRPVAIACAVLAALSLVTLGFGQQVDPAKKDNKPAAKGDAKEQGKSVTNSIGMKLVYIPPGKFLMGSPEGEAQRVDEEFQHQVEITKGFYMGVYDVTQEEYEKVMGKNPSFFCAKGLEKDKVAKTDTRRFPVEGVTWHDANAFCAKLTATDGKTYRLPTEAEWEYACRAGTTTPFHFGGTMSSTNQSNYDGNYKYPDAFKGPKGIFRQQPTPVGSFPANAFGLHDMHGNVWQWCADRYDDQYYKNSPRTDPVNTNEKFANVVVRGGSWLHSPRSCRSAQRGDSDPSNDDGVIGFRVVLAAP